MGEKREMTSYSGTNKKKDFSCEILLNKVLMEYPEMDPKKAKYLQYDKVTVLMKHEHKTLIDLLSKKIHKQRIPNKRSERITANMIIRCLIEVLNENQDNCSFSNIHYEKDLKEEIKKIFTSEEK